MNESALSTVHTGPLRMVGLVSTTARLTTARVDPELDSAARAERSLMAPVPVLLELYVHRSSVRRPERRSTVCTSSHGVNVCMLMMLMILKI